jgi:hypothetical protein
MSLAKKLSQPSGSTVGLPCRIGTLLKGTQLNKEDKEKLAEVIETPYGTPGRYTNAAITKALREEGIEVGESAIAKHRRGECRCFGPNPKLGV